MYVFINTVGSQVIAGALRGLEPPAAVSLLDCTVQNVSSLPETLLQGVILHGLVVSSGEIHHVSGRAFSGLAGPLQALGLPNNKLQTVPTAALSALPTLDRLDLSHNHLETLTTGSFKVRGGTNHDDELQLNRLLHSFLRAEFLLGSS
jgi:Leucine-rich repeat (LRR) protein